MRSLRGPRRSRDPGGFRMSRARPPHLLEQAGGMANPGEGDQQLMSLSKPCSVVGCARASRAGGMCTPHYRRVRKTGSPGPAAIERREPRPPLCSLPGCDRPTHARGLCGTHYDRALATGSTDDPVHKTGPEHAAWRGDDAGYAAVHQRLKRIRGKASDHECECGSPAKHWAYDHTCPNEKWATRRGREVPYSTDLNHYQPMCLPCHVAIDRAHSKNREEARASA